MILRIEINLDCEPHVFNMGNARRTADYALAAMGIDEAPPEVILKAFQKGEPDTIQHLLHQLTHRDGEVAARVMLIDAEFDQRPVTEFSSVPFDKKVGTAQYTKPLGKFEA